MKPLVFILPDGKRIKADSITAWDTIANSGKDLTIHTLSDTGSPYTYTFPSAIAATVAASSIDNATNSGAEGNISTPVLSSLPAFSSIKWSTDNGVTWNNSPAPAINPAVQLQVNGTGLNPASVNIKTINMVRTSPSGGNPPQYACQVDSVSSTVLVTKNRTQFSFVADTYNLQLLDANGNVLLTQGSAIVFS